MTHAENHLATARQTSRYAASSLNPSADPVEQRQHGWDAASEMGNAVTQMGMGSTGSLEAAFRAASAALDSARQSHDAALRGALNTETVEMLLGAARIVRDTCITIEGSLVTVLTGGTAPAFGAVLAGAATAAVMGAEASVLDQYFERDQVAWGPLVATTILNVVTGALGGQLGNVVNRSIAERLTRVLSTQLASSMISASARDRITATVVPNIVNTIIARASAAPTALVSASYTPVGGRSATSAEVEAAFTNEVSVTAICREVINQTVAARAGTMPR